MQWPHLKFAMYSICLTAHLEFENWKHILSFATSTLWTWEKVSWPNGRGHLKVLNHLLLHKNCRGAESTLHGRFVFCFVSCFLVMVKHGILAESEKIWRLSLLHCIPTSANTPHQPHPPPPLSCFPAHTHRLSPKPLPDKAKGCCCKPDYAVLNYL